MNQTKELAKNTLIIFIGRIFTQFTVFALVPFYTHILSADDYGLIDLVITYIGLFVPIITIQLEMPMFRFLVDARNLKTEKSKVFSNITFLVSVLMLIFTILYISFSTIFNFNFKIEIGLCILASAFSSLFLQVARGLGDNKSFSFASIIIGITNLFLNFILLFFLKLGVSGILISSSISNILAVLFLLIKLKLPSLFNRKLVNKQDMRLYLRYSIPLVPNGIMWWIINVSDRTIISFIMGSAANGIYAVANKFSIILVTLFNTFNLSWTESASIHINSKSRDYFFSKILNEVIRLTLSTASVMIILLSFMFDKLVGSEFSESYFHIPFLIISTFFNIIVMFLGAIYIAKKKTKEVAKTSFLAGIINIVTNLVLINHIGILAGSISTIIAFLSMSIYRIIDVKKYVKLHLNYCLFLISSMILTFSILIYFQEEYLQKVIYSTIILISIAVINQSNIKNVFFLITKKKRKDSHVFIKLP